MGVQNDGSDLLFTGERVVLGKTPSLIALEHLVRYGFARQFVEGARVLDVACGTGYGSSILSEKAKSVIGIDISLETIQYARQNYSQPNLHYSIADCRSLPFQKGCFDLAVMFEAIEHVAEQEQSLNEIRRVLAPDGLLILSTPNAVAPTKAIEDVNPFHFKELTEHELLELLRPYFAHVRLLYQHEFSASSIQPPAVSTSDPVELTEDFSDPSAAKYFIAVCSAQEARIIRGRTLGVGGIEHQIAFLKDLHKFQEEIQVQAQQLTANEREYARNLSAHQREIEALVRQREQNDRDYSRNLALHQQELKVRQEALVAHAETIHILERKLQEVGRQLAELEIQNSVRKIELEWLYHWMPTNRLARKFLFGKNLRRRLMGKLSFQPKGSRPMTSVEADRQARNAVDTKPLEFHDSTDPYVSVIIPVYDGCANTRRCLESILRNTSGVEYEIIVVDDCSQDATWEMLSGIKGLRLFRNETNQGFIYSCNRGAGEGKGKYLLFLNDDTEVTPQWMIELLKTLESDPKAGAVGAKLVYPDGRLQEAGSILWRDGSALGYGRGDDPSKPEYEYLREVDYCSAACLLVRKDIFQELAGFDSQYTPAYYEDADLCMGIREKGYKVLFQPYAVVHHHEYASSTPDRSTNLMGQNQLRFVEKWRRQLQDQYECSSNTLRARSRGDSLRILVVDDRVPTPDRGSGYPRSHALLKFLVELKFNATLFPALDPGAYQPYLDEFRQLGVEVVCETDDFDRFSAQRAGSYDVVLVSRPHNFQKTYFSIKKFFPNARLIYDAEALYFVRDELKAKAKGKSIGTEERGASRRAELSLLTLADAIMCVSEFEKSLMCENLEEITHKVFVWGHPLSPQLTPRAFRDRKDLLFVGAFPSTDSPNEDAVVYFIEEIFPEIEKVLNCSFSIVGADPPGSVRKHQSPRVKALGYIKDLSDCYDVFKVFVVPHRYSAGIPLKLSEAMSRGIPAVVSSLTARQFSLTDGQEVLIGDTPKEFARKVIELYQDESLWNAIRENALAFIRETHDPDILRSRLDEIIRSIFRTPMLARGCEVAQDDTLNS